MLKEKAHQVLFLQNLEALTYKEQEVLLLSGLIFEEAFSIRVMVIKLL